jgi:hypothetical protein
LTDATIALACAHGISETVLAKREISRLWDNTSRTPYKALFNAEVAGSKVWISVELTRWVDQALESMRASYEGRDRLIVVHGNRVILWAIMSYLDINNMPVADFKPPFGKPEVNDLTRYATEGLRQIVLKHFPEAYPAPLFKNLTKCRVLGAELLKWLEGFEQFQATESSMRLRGRKRKEKQ